MEYSKLKKEKDWEKKRGLGWIMINHFMMGSIDMVSLGINNSFPNEALPILMSTRMRGCLNLSNIEFLMSLYDIFVLDVGRDTEGRFLAYIEAFFRYGESGQNMKNCPK